MTNNIKDVRMEEAIKAYDILTKIAMRHTRKVYKYVGKSYKDRKNSFLFSSSAEEFWGEYGVLDGHYSLCYDDHLVYDSIGLTDILKFSESEGHRRLLLDLLDSFLKVWDCWDKDNLEFKVKGITPSDLIENGKSISFTDNIDGLTSYFAPTKSHIDEFAKRTIDFDVRRYMSVIGIWRPRELRSEVPRLGTKEIPANSVVSEWHIRKNDLLNHPSQSDLDRIINGDLTVNGHLIDVWSYSYTFKPFVTLSPEGYKMHVKNEKDFEVGISRFKTRFKTTYIPCHYSPIILDVHPIICKSYKRFCRYSNNIESVRGGSIKLL